MLTDFHNCLYPEPYKSIPHHQPQLQGLFLLLPYIHILVPQVVSFLHQIQRVYQNNRRGSEVDYIHKYGEETYKYL
jgi:hypothetical protein